MLCAKRVLLHIRIRPSGIIKQKKERNTLQQIKANQITKRLRNSTLKRVCTIGEPYVVDRTSENNTTLCSGLYVGILKK